MAVVLITQSKPVDIALVMPSPNPNAWVPQSKPIWFTELGCPAINRGSNQPNVFTDLKSSESATPYYSTGERDDLIQRMFMEAHFSYWANSANNPTSTQYSGTMVDTSNIYVWTWDARPFPYFPSFADVWSDAPNYYLGHWINGRAGAVSLPQLVASICDYAKFSDYDVSDLRGLITGFQINSTTTPRGALTPLMQALHFDGIESDGKIKFIMRGRPAVTAMAEADLVINPDDATLGVAYTRAAESTLPLAFRVTYIDPSAEYRQSILQSKRLVGDASRVKDMALPMVLDQGQAKGIGDRLIQESWMEREGVKFSLRPSLIALDPSDEVSLTVGTKISRLRLTETHMGYGTQVGGVACDPSLYDSFVGPLRGVAANKSIPVFGRPLITIADLPMLSSTVKPWAPYAGTSATPWPGAVDLFKSASTSEFAIDTLMTKQAELGLTVTALSAGPEGTWDYANVLRVNLFSGTFASESEISILGGNNTIAVENQNGDWEVLQFQNATLVASQTWDLSKLLRGQLGTEAAMKNPVPAGARVMVLDANIYQVNLPQSQYALAFYYKYGPDGVDVNSAAYQTEQHQYKGVGMRPYSPVHVTGTKNYVSGDIVLAWFRRDRVNADSWDQTEIPMSETSESYEVDVLNGSTVVRTLATVTPTVTYLAANQVTDFGTAPASFDVIAYQISSVVGRGTGRRVTINV